MKGTPDLIILNRNEKQKFSGFAMEFKSPSRDSYLSHDQQNILIKLSQNGYKTYSNDYNIIIHELKNTLKQLFINARNVELNFRIDVIKNIFKNVMLINFSLRNT